MEAVRDAMRRAPEVIHRPFCSMECNREYADTVVGRPPWNDRPTCLMCGSPVGQWDRMMTMRDRLLRRVQ